MARLLAILLVTVLGLTSFVKADTISVAAASTITLYANGAAVIQGVHHPFLKYPICSGWVFGEKDGVTEIMTAAHCVKHSSDFEVNGFYIGFYNGEVEAVIGKSISRTQDLALLFVKSDRPHVSPELAKGIVLGEPLFLIGDAAGRPWTYASGRVASTKVFHDVTGPFGQWECSACYFGDSGSAIFNAQGEVVGLEDALDDNQPATNFFIPFFIPLNNW